MCVKQTHDFVLDNPSRTVLGAVIASQRRRFTLNRTQVLRFASKFAPGHRVERSGFGTFRGSQKVNPPKPEPSSCSFSDKLTETRAAGTDKTDWPLHGLALSSEGSVQVHAASTAASGRRKGGMGDWRRRPPTSLGDSDPAFLR